MSAPLTAVELFAGAGGLALGAERAGFAHAALYEWDGDSCATLRRNRPAWRVVEADVHDVNFTTHAGVDLVAGGPPCQPFSTAGRRELDKDDRDMFPEAIRAVKEARPRAVLFENVTGLVKGDALAYLEGYVMRRLRELGYAAEWRVLNAADYGVPQARKRVITVAFHRDVGARWQWPAPTHGRAALLAAWDEGRVPDPFVPRRTVRDALAGLPPHEPPDPSAIEGGGSFVMVHNLDAPAWTITTRWTSALLREPARRLRLLSIRELARLQTFPDDWRFAGTNDAQLRQIGNAVPPALAHALMAALARALGHAPAALAA